MKQLLITLFVTGFLAGCAAQGSNVRYTDAAPAGDQPNILVMGEDADTDTVSRGGSVFKRVLDALAEEMNGEGFKVYDEVAATIGGFTQGRSRRTDAEIIDIARSVKSVPIDVAVIFSIYPGTEVRGYGRKLRVRISGRLLNVQNGQRLGNFEVDTQAEVTIASDCDRRCELERVGFEARGLARDLGAVLAKKLDWLSPVSRNQAEQQRPVSGEENRSGLSMAYVLKFSGFGNQEIEHIEEILTGFRGYEHHHPVSSSYRTHEYWYESSGGTAYLNRNLRLMLDDLNVTGRVVFAGNSFTIEKISNR
jgi:hypothetical protein